MNRSVVVPDRLDRHVHRSQIVTPWIEECASVESRRALRLWGRYNPHEPIVWRWQGKAIYWSTLRRDELETELVKLAKRRERGLQISIADLSRWTGYKRDSVSRALRALAARGVATLEVGKGRHGRITFRIVAQSITQPYKAMAATLTARPFASAVNEVRERAWRAEEERWEREQARLAEIAFG